MLEDSKRTAQQLAPDAVFARRPRKADRSLAPFTAKERKEIAELLQILAAASGGGPSSVR